MPRLTATSYAVLALLARTPYSAYDLTGEIKASLAQCLPRSATLLYREPKNLVAHGFAEVEIQLKGRQKRAVYSITESGRSALAQWLASPPAAPVFESEAVVRAVFGHLGSRADLVSSLETLENQVRDLAQAGFGSIPGGLDRCPVSAEHVADQELVADLYTDLYALLIDWSRRARESVQARPEQWPDGAEQAALDRLRKVLGGAPRSRVDTLPANHRIPGVFPTDAAMPNS
ncbi:MAG TPA: PadR family transcriptional regulator [Sporichthyaceae bacterium]|jgi:DNA-binding PadR family transcriptional regulator|nr:PadR family transcriptional regulator [Sporichthyaceae bacterium]